MNLKSFTNVEKKLCPCCNSDQTKYLGMRGGKYQREGLGIESKIVQCINCSVIYPNPFLKLLNPIQPLFNLGNLWS